MKLHFGWGNEYLEGYVNIDNSENVKTDICYDLNSIPYPFKENSIDEIYMVGVLEHLKEPMKLIEEWHRICKNDAKIIIRGVPHCSNTISYHITHIRTFCKNALDIYEYGSQYGFITNCKFDIKSKINWTSKRKFPFWLMNPIMNWIINYLLWFKRIDLYERFFCWIMPSEEIIFELRVKKELKILNNKI